MVWASPVRENTIRYRLLHIVTIYPLVKRSPYSAATHPRHSAPGRAVLPVTERLCGGGALFWQRHRMLAGRGAELLVRRRHPRAEWSEGRRHAAAIGRDRSPPRLCGLFPRAAVDRDRLGGVSAPPGAFSRRVAKPRRTAPNFAARAAFY